MQNNQRDSAKKSPDHSPLMKLFEDELKDMYWAEKALLKALPKMIKNATSSELVNALENHLAETGNQVNRLDEVFNIIGKKAVARKCESMEGMITEGEELMKELGRGPVCDAGIIAASQKIEHYEIASYGTLRQFAETLDITDAVELLQTTLDEEKEADEILTEIAVSEVNLQAADFDR
jgi:ferritin-like metal-binding protein YciE